MAKTKNTEDKVREVLKEIQSLQSTISEARARVKELKSSPEYNEAVKLQKREYHAKKQEALDFVRALAESGNTEAQAILN